MTGITSYGAYVPMLRLSLGAIAGSGRKGGGGSGERSIAYFDEDAVTMAVAAGTHCLRGIDRSRMYDVTLDNTGESFRISGRELADVGLTIRLDGNMLSELVLYSAVGEPAA
jgi:hypothetical protein